MALKLRRDSRKQSEREPRPAPDEAPLEDAEAEGPQPQPELTEPTLTDPGLTDLSRRDYVAIVKRAVKRASSDHITSIAAALAYYAFLAIPSALLVAAGVFSLVAGPDAVSTVIDKLHGIVPAQAITLIESSLRNLTQNDGTSITVLAIGTVLALWSLTGAMQNIMWALNIAYDRDEGRGFVRRRITALWMILFALIGFALAFGVLVLGPQLSTWIGDWLGLHTEVKLAWYIAEWPLLVLGLLFVFAALMHWGPNVEHPRWHFLTFGAILSLVVWIAASGAFAFYASRFSSYNKTWGSLAAVVVMLTWLWLSGCALLLGAEVNAESERSRELRRGEPAEVELQAPAKA
jgi:membrane protein